MKKHNTLKVVLIALAVAILLSWILPVASFYSSGYGFIDGGYAQVGLFDLSNYVITALSYFGYISLFVLIVGGFYGVLNRVGAYRTLLDKLAACFKGKEVVVLSIMMVLIAVLTSVCGLQLGLIVFFPMLVSLILLMGFDKVVAALTLVGSTMIGLLGTTYGYNNTGMITSILGNKFTDDMLVKCILLFLGLVLLILNTILYIRKSKNNAKKVTVKKVVAKETTKDKKTTKAKATKDTKAAVKEESVVVVAKNEEEEDSYVPAAVSGEKHVVWPLAVILGIIFVILVLSFTSWSGAFGLDFMQKAHDAVVGFEIFGFPIFSKILGSAINPFGSWSIVELMVVMVVFMLILALIYKVKFTDMLSNFAQGAKKAIAPAVVILFIYTILVVTTYHGYQLVIDKAILGLTDGFNVFTTFIVAILSALFNVDASYAFQSSLPYLASIVTNTENYSLISVVYQAAYGFVMLIAPTSIILMGVLSYLKISFGKWFKAVWQLLLELLVVLLIIFTILVLI